MYNQPTDKYLHDPIQGAHSHGYQNPGQHNQGQANRGHAQDIYQQHGQPQAATTMGTHHYTQPQSQRPQQQGKPQINRQKSIDHTHDSPLEIVRQGYGVNEQMKLDMIEFFKVCHTQNEYKNPADYIKHKLDCKYGPFWFIFMWEDSIHQKAQYSYYNNDDRVFEFKIDGWHVLIYSFNQTQYTKDVFVPANKEEVVYHQPPTMLHHYPLPPPQYDPYFDDYYDSRVVDPRYPYPSMIQRQPQSYYRPRDYY